MQKQELPKNQQCLNCGHNVGELKYCPQCGQENLDYRVKLGVLIRYYVSKYARFDIKWITTIKMLFTQPWQLTQIYLEGKRKQYTHPFRMYLALSVLFFLGLRLQVTYKASNDKSLNIGFFSITTESQVSMQKIVAQVMTQLPNATLISVPLVAMILTGLYYHHRKKYLFYDHFIFMLYYYSLVYLISLPFLFIPRANTLFLMPLLVSSAYLWLFIKRFYQENFIITTVKYLVFSFFSTVIIVLLSVLLMIAIIIRETALK